MPITAVTFVGKKLEPFIESDAALQLHANLPNSITYPRGQVLGELSATPGTYKAYSGALIAAGAAPVLSTGAAGILPAATYVVGYTYVNSLGGESVLSATQTFALGASLQLAVAAVTPLPTGAVSVNWYMSVVGAAGVVNIPMRLVVNNNGAAFSINSVPAANAPSPPLVSTAYVNTDGSQIPRALLVYDCATDGSGNITLGGASQSEFGETVKSAPIYVRGVFKCEDLTGLDANSVDQTRPGANGFFLREGTTTTGIVSIG